MPAANDRLVSPALTGSTPMTLTAGIKPLDSGGDPRRQPAAADRDQDPLQVRHVLGQFEARPFPGPP